MDNFADLYPQYDIHVYGIDEKIIQKNIKDNFFITGNAFYQNLPDVYPGYLPDEIFEVIEPDKSDIVKIGQEIIITDEKEYQHKILKKNRTL